MRIYINQEERNFLMNFFFDYIEDFLAEEHCDECDLPDDIEIINSLLKKLSYGEKRVSRIRYVYEKI